MTDNFISDHHRSEAVHQALRKMAERIARDEQCGLSADEQLQKVSRELEASRSEYWAVTDFIPAAFIVLDNKGIVKRANAHARKMLTGGFKPLIGLAFSTFVAPEDMVVYLQQIKRIPVEKLKSCPFELRMRDYAGRNIHTYGQVLTRFDAEGNMVHWHLAFFDISEQKRLSEALRVSKEHLAMATAAGNIGIWVSHLTTGQTHWNEQLYRMLGLEPRNGPEEREVFLDRVHPDDRRRYLADIEAAIQSGDKLERDFRIIRADDGRLRWLASRGTIERDNSGRAVRMQGTTWDITDRKEAEETLRLAQLQLAKQLAETERINEELSQFAYAVTHDLKAPLRAIANYVEFLNEDLGDTLTGDQKDYLKGLKTAVAQGDALINDLLSFSRLGRTPPVAEAVDVPGLVNEICALLNVSHDVEIEVQPQWPNIRTDYSLLKQILQNLIANGLKFNRRNPKRIAIGWQKAGNGHIEIFVRDNGIGIAPEYSEQIFQIFRRLHTSREYEGTGIGLAIVQKAAQNLGGSVRLESIPGEGSAFYVNLPTSMLE